MANREIFPPSSPFPLIAGDVRGAAGATTLTVTGIQGVQVSSVSPTNGQVLVYSATDSEWEPGAGGSTNAIMVNGSGVSQDGLIFVNGTLINQNGYFGLSVNGTRVV